MSITAYLRDAVSVCLACIHLSITLLKYDTDMAFASLMQFTYVQHACRAKSKAGEITNLVSKATAAVRWLCIARRSPDIFRCMQCKPLHHLSILLCVLYCRTT